MSWLFNQTCTMLSATNLAFKVTKQEDGWKLGWMNIAEKLKMKRFMPHPLHLIVGLTIIILIFQRFVKCLLPFPHLIWIFMKLSTFWKTLKISLMTYVLYLLSLKPGNWLFKFFLLFSVFSPLILLFIYLFIYLFYVLFYFSLVYWLFSNSYIT